MALLGGLREVAGLRVEADLLREEADRHGRRLDELISSNDEHLAVLRQLEQAYDEEAAAGELSGTSLPFTDSDIPSGDELAAELERFLREQGR
jgi:hypothetical protein